MRDEAFDKGLIEEKKGISLEPLVKVMVDASATYLPDKKVEFKVYFAENLTEE